MLLSYKVCFISSVGSFKILKKAGEWRLKSLFLLLQKSNRKLTEFFRYLRIVITKIWIQGIPAFRDFTIRDPLYFVIQFQASILWIPYHFMILKKKSKKKFFFWNFFGKISDFQVFWIIFVYICTVIAITRTLRIPS